MAQSAQTRLYRSIHHTDSQGNRRSISPATRHSLFQVTKGSDVIPFYSMPEFEQWQASTPNWQKWKCKYYKGLFPPLRSSSRSTFLCENSQVWVLRLRKKRRNTFPTWNDIVSSSNTIRSKTIWPFSWHSIVLWVTIERIGSNGTPKTSINAENRIYRRIISIGKIPSRSISMISSTKNWCSSPSPAQNVRFPASWYESLSVGDSSRFSLL